MKLLLLSIYFAVGLCEISILDCGAVAGTVNCTYDSNTLTLTFSGNGDLATTSPWRVSPFQNANHIVFEEGITSIPASGMTCSFRSPFSNLITVTIESTTITIGNSAFANCNKLTHVYFNEDSKVTSIGSLAFSGCSTLAIFNATDVQEIKDSAFTRCSVLALFDFSKVTTIGKEAFLNTAIVYADFGSALQSFGDRVFEGCTSLSSLRVTEENEKYWSVEDVLFELKEGKRRVVMYPYAKQSTEFSIPDGIDIIPFKSFSSVTHLQYIHLGNDTTDIEKGAFDTCSNLKKITIGRSLVNWQVGSFVSCPIEIYEVDRCNPFFGVEDGILMTKSVDNKAIVKYPSSKTISATYEIPSGIRVIYDYAFSDLKQLETLTIGNDVYSLHSYAFSGCSNLKKVTLSGSITSIGSSVFAELTSLEEVVIGKNVKMIGSHMFNGCTALKTITIEENSQLLSIEEYAFRSVGVTSFVIPDSVIYVMQSAFSESSLESVTIGKNVVGIGSQAFESCSSLKTVTFNTDNLLTIDNAAFNKCTSLESIDIPSTVEIVSLNVFSGCTSLKTVNFSGTKQPAFCAENTFDANSAITVNVPQNYEQLEFCGITLSKDDE